MKWHFYAYWHKMRSWQTYEGKPDPARGENAYYGNTFNPGHQSPFSKNTWICVEAMVKANDPGKSNGEMAFWINGVKQGEWKRGQPMGSWVADKFVTSGKDNTHPQPFEGFDFRLTDSLKINQIALQFYVSKEYAQRGNASRNVVYFDDVVVAQHYIGPKDQ